jgi:hypothetical protein
MYKDARAGIIPELFPAATGREYTLHWSNGSEKRQKGWIRMTDLLFNYYFWITAFGFDGAWETRTVAASNSITRRREIGGTAKVYSRKGFSYTVVPTFRSNGYDTGHQFYVQDGDDLWNFEVGGNINEFRIWLHNTAKLTNLKRIFTYRDAHGVGDSAVPAITVNP